MEENVKTKPKPIERVIHVDEEILEDAKDQSEVEKQVIVHCYLKPSPYESAIRIWNSTYLRDKDSSHKSKLISSHNITIYPTWMTVKGGKGAKFTLVFSSLPKSCKSFDLFEDIPQGCGFYTGLISRNKSDVYSVIILF
jgi:hypothetical protein